MGNNAVLKRKAKRAIRQVRKLSRHSGATEHVYRDNPLHAISPISKKPLQTLSSIHGLETENAQR
jgi:hypothetical protein